MHSNRSNLIVRARPNTRMLCRKRLDPVLRTRSYQALLKKADVIARCEFVRAQVDDGVCDELAGAVECRLPAA